MSRILNSEVFDCDKDLKSLCDEVCRWLSCFEDFAGKHVVVRIETTGDDRTRKKSAQRKLAELVICGEDVWKQSAYEFNFKAREYKWNNREIHVTAGEALFLYRWLVLNDETHKEQMYYLKNIRRRLGKEFLSEVHK
jgi:hypothetical protein